MAKMYGMNSEKLVKMRRELKQQLDVYSKYGVYCSFSLVYVRAKVLMLGLVQSANARNDCLQHATALSVQAALV